ncbi:MAG: DUF4352 domain-containing protein [Ktedonobacteraceae bacterium]
MSYVKRLIACSIVVICLLLLAACSGAPTTNTTSTPTATPTQLELSANPTTRVTGTPTTPSTATPAVGAPTSTPGSGPLIILTPTPVSGGGATSQLVTLADRTLTITSVSQQQGGSANTMAITLVMAVHNTGAKSIQNQASFYKLVGAEGDIFGLQSSATASFFGTILPQGSLNGTIVFQVPTAAANGLRLLFRSEVVTETVFVPLKIQ